MTTPPPPIDYRGPGRPRRRGPRGGDWCFAALVGACYTAAVVAASAMPAGYHWSEAWEWTNFALTITACTSVGLCVIGVQSGFREGLLTCPRLTLITTAMAGGLPIVEFLLARRWLAINFA